MWTQEKVHVKITLLEVSAMRDWKTFSEEEVKALRANSYVKSVTAKMIRFTVEFKKEFWRLYHKECRQPVKIMQELGFDTDVLGERRIAGILLHIREQVVCPISQ